jgi:hypothetical protein
MTFSRASSCACMLEQVMYLRVFVTIAMLTGSVSILRDSVYQIKQLYLGIWNGVDILMI